MAEEPSWAAAWRQRHATPSPSVRMSS
jgi:hypothetical protein